MYIDVLYCGLNMKLYDQLPTDIWSRINIYRSQMRIIEHISTLEKKLNDTFYVINPLYESDRAYILEYKRIERIIKIFNVLYLNKPQVIQFNNDRPFFEFIQNHLNIDDTLNEFFYKESHVLCDFWIYIDSNKYVISCIRSHSAPHKFPEFFLGDSYCYRTFIYIDDGYNIMESECILKEMKYSIENTFNRFILEKQDIVYYQNYKFSLNVLYQFEMMFYSIEEFEYSKYLLRNTLRIIY
jgi:hypothetical protein